MSETDYQAEETGGTPPAPTPALPTTRPTLHQSHEGEHHDDFGSTEIPISKSVQIFAFCAAMNSCNLGYDVGVSTHAGQLIQQEWGITDLQRESFIGCLNASLSIYCLVERIAENIGSNGIAYLTCF